MRVTGWRSASRGTGPHLRAVAYRMLGSLNEVDDAVQETWLRLSRSDVSEIENLGIPSTRLYWLTQLASRCSWS
jgi:RNA polymerase sigma-70 factor (ECF subfamily)